MPEYYRKADVWPLNPKGDLLVITMIESVLEVQNLDDIHKDVEAFGCCLIGEGDPSQVLGHRREYEHSEVRDAMKYVLETCKKHGVPIGHTRVASGNIEKIVADGYRFIMSAPVRAYDAIHKAKEMTANSIHKPGTEQPAHGEH
jgi:4-hydroxy-2-oxoheptanedioate aldolase